MTGLFDTHCHLTTPPLCDDPAAVMGRARAAGVEAVLVPGIDEVASAAAVGLSRALPGVLAAVGVHPEVADRRPPDLAAIERLVDAGGVSAIGEIGLDGIGEGRDAAAQDAAFLAQLELARDRCLPVLVHCRSAWDRLLGALGRIGPLPAGGIVHAYKGSIETARRLERLGFRLGVGCVATRPEAGRLRGVVAALDLSSLVLETDAPYIATALRPRGAVEPADLPEVARALAALKGIDVDRVAEVTTANARSVLTP